MNREVIFSPLEIIENKIRFYVYSARVRISEYFRDFDRLRTGYLSRGQFRSCLSHTIEKGPTISDDEFKVLFQQYDLRKNNTVHYLSFIESIDKVFGGKNLEKNPTFSTLPPSDLLHHLPSLSPEIKKKYEDIFERLRQYVRHHGSDVKSWYQDFDKHNSGYVTMNQYRRGFPPNLLASEEEMDLLLKLYGDDTTQTVNYYKMNKHVNRKPLKPKTKPTNQLIPHPRDNEVIRHPVGTETILVTSEVTKSSSNIDDLLWLVQKRVYVFRLRLLDFFKDYDKHNTGLVTQTQFHAALNLSQLKLELNEIYALTKMYLIPDGRVSYQTFCAAVDEVFTSRKVEIDPKAEITSPPIDALTQDFKPLSPENKEKYFEIIQRIRSEVERKSLNLLTFFKDLDSKSGKCGQITRSQFARLMSMVGICITEAELYILLEKYRDPLHINYFDFVRQVDPEYFPVGSKHKPHDAQRPKDPSSNLSVRSAKQLLDEIVYQVNIRSIRISEFLRDFDLLKTGTVARSDFIRALNHMGFAYSPEEYEILANFYKDPVNPDRCRWRKLELDAEEANGVFRDLEKLPSFSVKVPNQSNASSMYFSSSLNEEEATQLHEAINCIATHLRTRSIAIKQLFQDFDKFSSGRVSRSQLRQVLSSVGIHLSDSVFDLICHQWSSKGHDTKSVTFFSYLPFVKEVESLIKEKIMPEPVLLNPIIPKIQKPLLDIHQILLRLKTKVKTERIRVYDILHDFDPLRSGFITENEFLRGIQTFNFGLQPEEAQTLAHYYQLPEKGIDYRKFSDDMESVFTMKELEKYPTYTPQPFQPTWHEHKTKQAINLDANWLQLMNRLTDEARQRRMFMLLRYLEDHDKIHTGTITKAQLCSSLSAAGYSIDEDEADILLAKYGLEDDENQIDYLSFNDDLTRMVNITSGHTDHLENSKMITGMRKEAFLPS